jgi:hypothetical protein
MDGLIHEVSFADATANMEDFRRRTYLSEGWSVHLSNLILEVLKIKAWKLSQISRVRKFHDISNSSARKQK